jgi:transcriptional regulator with XRE-family HTH domain
MPVPSDASLRRTLVECIRGILATKDLTLYGVAALARLRHPREPAYHLPHNFYFQLQSTGLTPTLHQLSALAEVSNYRLADWLRVFGFRLDDIACFEADLPRPRTALIDATVGNIDASIPWFQDRLSRDRTPPVAPLSQLLEPSGAVRLSSLPFLATSGRFCYAKIGQQDAFAFPDLAPGSIVRVNPRLVARYLWQAKRKDTNRIFLVEHHGGFCCSRLHFGTSNRVTLQPTQLPFASIELELGSEARILGLVDLEIRPLIRPKRLASPVCALPEVPPELARLWTPILLEETPHAGRPARLLHAARLRAALSLRTASAMSRDVAKALGDKRYFISQGALSDYEANDAPPRHIHKLLTLSILYALPFQELLTSYGADPASGANPIPEEWMPGREGREDVIPRKPSVRGFLSDILERSGELPFFLYGSLAPLSGLPELSLHDVFWVGGQLKAMHPALSGALFIVVNRRKTAPPAFRRKSLWEQPLYLVLRREGSYVLANCTLEDNTIVVHPHVPGFAPHERLGNRVDAEVVGQIVVVVRSLFPPTPAKY